MYPVMILALFLVLPVLSIVVEAMIRRRRPAPHDLLMSAGRWFTFWAVGARLFTAGVTQVANPSYTAESIFGISDPVVLPFVSELGFANIAMGTIALVSVARRSWIAPAALVGAVYFGLAGLRHLIEGGTFTDTRLIAMVSDLFIGAVLAAFLIAVGVRAIARHRATRIAVSR